MVSRLKTIVGDADYSDEILFCEIVWDDILAAHEKKLDDVLKKALKAKRRLTWSQVIFIVLLVALIAAAFFKQPVWAAAFFLFFIYTGYKLYFLLRTDFASRFVIDILGYGNAQTRDLIQKRIDTSLKNLNPHRENPEKAPFTFVSHSLGTVIASDYVWDRQNPDFHPALMLSNFFTMGSPLALFALRFGREMFDRPIRIEDPQGTWINFLDNDDPIAYPLRPLNAAYEYTVNRDLDVETGMIGVAHFGYWPCKAVHKAIGQKLAEDWIRLNGK